MIKFHWTQGINGTYIRTSSERLQKTFSPTLIKYLDIGNRCRSGGTFLASEKVQLLYFQCWLLKRFVLDMKDICHLNRQFCRITSSSSICLLSLLTFFFGLFSLTLISSWPPLLFVII